MTAFLPPPSAQTTLLTSYLHRLRLPVFLAHYPKVAADAAQEGLNYEQFLLLLAEQELAQRDENMQRRRLSQAKFPVLKTLDQYDFSLMPQLNRPLVLELTQGHYIANRENILLVGQIGTGKTHLATAFGVAACRQGYRVRFLTAAGLTNDLLEAQATHRLSRVEQQLLRHQLLILDEVGFVPFHQARRGPLVQFPRRIARAGERRGDDNGAVRGVGDALRRRLAPDGSLVGSADLPRAYRAVRGGKLPVTREHEAAGGGTSCAMIAGGGALRYTRKRRSRWAQISPARRALFSIANTSICRA